MTRWIRALVLVVAATALSACGAGTDPQRLAVGDCFDVPSEGGDIESIAKRACTDDHTGEVFHIFEAAIADETYLSDPAWEQLVYPICDPVFETYTGTFVGDRLDIGYLYFVPTPDRWTAGDRRVTCFITSLDGTPLSQSHRAP